MNTRIIFLEQLNLLRHDILAMATKVEENLEKALCALRNNDAELAKEVCAEDSKVDAMQLKIEDEAAIIIATQQPVARDLREMVSIFRLTSSIERIGDHAVHLAKTAIKIAGNESASFSAREHLEIMAETGRKMIRAAVDAYLAQDAEAARKTAALDGKIDAEHKILTEKILHHMKEHPGKVKKAARILNISNQLERLGDHITNICEAVIYMTEGRHEELNE